MLYSRFEDIENLDDFYEDDRQKQQARWSPSSLPPTSPGQKNNGNEEIPINNFYITTDPSNFPSPLFVTSNDYDNIQNFHLETCQRVDTSGQNPGESSQRSIDEPADHTIQTLNDAPMIVDPKNQLQKKTPSIKKRKRSTSAPTSSKQIQQKTTTNENRIDNAVGITVSLLFLLNNTIDMRTDRDTELSDCFGNSPVVVIHGHLPECIEMKLDIISTDNKNNHHHSLYRFNDSTDGQGPQFKNTLRRQVQLEKWKDDIYTAKLDQLYVRKERSSKREIENGNGKSYKLTCYPSGEEEIVKAKGPTIFADKYNLNKFRLAIQFLSNNPTEPIKINATDNTSFFLSNFVEEVSNLKRKSHATRGKLNIKNLTPNIHNISFDDLMQCSMEFLIELPEELRNARDSECKWLEISLLNKGKLTNIYSIETDQGYRNPKYTNIKNTSFTRRFSVHRQRLNELYTHPDVIKLFDVVDLSENDFKKMLTRYDLNSFSVRFRLFHGVKINGEVKLPGHASIPIWESEKFIDNFNSSNNINTPNLSHAAEEHLTFENTSEECDISHGLPVTRATGSNHNEQQTNN